MVFQVFIILLFLTNLAILVTMLLRHLARRRRKEPEREELPLDDFKGDQIIEVINLKKAFEEPVLKGISFDIKKGETVGILGASGSGKSVTLKIIAGFLKPDHGWVMFKGRDIVKMSERRLLEVRKRLSYVFQHGAVFDFLTVSENIEYPMREMGITDEEVIRKRVKYLLNAVELEGMGHQEYDELSSGSKKQVAIGRAIANNPEVILYDEPTTGVDPIIGKSLSRLIRKLNRQEQLTSIVVTHDMKCMRIVADRIILLKNGVIHFTGDLEQLAQSRDPYVRAFVEGRRYREPEGHDRLGTSKGQALST